MPLYTATGVAFEREGDRCLAAANSPTTNPALRAALQKRARNCYARAARS